MDTVLQLQLFDEVRLPAPPSLNMLRSALRVRARGAVDLSQREVAEALTARAVEAFWAVFAPRVPLRPPPSTHSADKPMTDAARQLGFEAASRSLEEAADQIGLLYSGLLPDAWRARHGIYFTPPRLADRLLDQAEAAGIDWATARILDPAAGAGAFLVRVVRRAIRALGPCDPAFVVRNLNARIHGYELDPFAAWLGQVFIDAAVQLDIGVDGRRLEPVIEIRDSLGDFLPVEGFDLVVGNPPFGRVTLPPEQRSRFARSVYGHANLYGLFLDRAIQLAAPRGVVSFLTPSSFLGGEYFKNLRATLVREARPVEIDFVTLRNGVFEDVLQETVLATYRKGTRTSRVRVNFVRPERDLPVVSEKAGVFLLPRDPCVPWLIARHPDDAALVARMRKMPYRLADWGYKVSTGPLVWNRHKGQLSDEHGADTMPLVWAESITSDGRFFFQSLKRNHKPFFRRLPGDGWLEVRKPCVLLQRTTAREQARRLIAAEIPAGFIAAHEVFTVENHLNMLVPIGDRPPVSLGLLAAFFNSVAADRVFRCMSGSVAVSAYELESLPLPSAAELTDGLGESADRAMVDSVCRALYGESELVPAGPLSMALPSGGGRRSKAPPGGRRPV